MRTIVTNVVKNQKRKPQGKRWDFKTKLSALAIFKRSPKTYRYMEKAMQLPSLKTLQRLLKNFPIETGIHRKVINILKKKANNFPSEDKYCTLLFDEMALKKRCIYNDVTETIEGYEDFGQGENMGRRDRVADHALVFMMQGIRIKYKQPVAHYFVTKTISAEKLTAIIKQVISALTDAGFNIIATVCDQAPTNIGALNLLKTLNGQPTDDNFFFGHENQKVYIMYDVPHLFKSIRNNFFNGGIFKLNNSIAKWQHLEEAEELNRNNFLNFTKLTKTVVKPTYKIKMRVKYAAHALSNTTAAILKMMAWRHDKSDEVLQTAAVVEELDKLFDCTNGPSSHKDIKRGIRQNVSKDSNHIEKWNYYKDILKKGEFLNDKMQPLRNVRCLKGFEMSLQSLKDIWSTLQSKPGFHYLNLRQLNQDSLENFFGLIRQHSPTNKNPTCTHFVAAMKTSIISGLLAPHTFGANCEDDRNNFLLDTYKDIMESEEKKSSGITPDYTEVEDESSFPVLSIPEETLNKYENDLCSFQEQPIVYVSGYIASKLTQNSSCMECINCLKIDKPNNEDLYRYISLREWWTDKVSLTYPSRDLCDFVNEAQTLYTNTISKELYKNNLCQLCSLHFSTLNLNWFKCKTHINEMLTLLFKLLSRLFIRKSCKDKNIQFETAERDQEDKRKKAQQQGKEK